MPLRNLASDSGAPPRAWETWGDCYPSCVQEQNPQSSLIYTLHLAGLIHAKKQVEKHKLKVLLGVICGTISWLAAAACWSRVDTMNLADNWKTLPPTITQFLLCFLLNRLALCEMSVIWKVAMTAD